MDQICRKIFILNDFKVSCNSISFLMSVERISSKHTNEERSTLSYMSQKHELELNTNEIK